MFHHTINVDDCKGFEVSSVLASSSSERKRLCVVVVPEFNAMRYDIFHGEQCVYTNERLANAVDNYNSIQMPPKVRTQIVKVHSDDRL